MQYTQARLSREQQIIASPYRQPAEIVAATSVIIPNRNGAATLAACLDAVLASAPRPLEVLVVDDASDDGSRALAARYACRWLALPQHRGAAAARNQGALQARGQYLFFLDADCYTRPDTLRLSAACLAANDCCVLVGGSYEPAPAGIGFFGRFQSALVHYWETRRCADPDYVATHALMTSARCFRDSGGFREGGLPILEDVDYSHRMKQAGRALRIEARALVTHGRDYSLGAWLHNAWRKAHYWTIYSLARGDWHRDSGAASRALKFNVVCAGVCGAGALALAAGAGVWVLAACAATQSLNVFVNRGVLRALARVGGVRFAAAAVACYLAVYPLAAGTGAVTGTIRAALATRKLRVAPRRDCHAGGR